MLDFPKLASTASGSHLRPAVTGATWHAHFVPIADIGQTIRSLLGARDRRGRHVEVTTNARGDADQADDVRHLLAFHRHLPACDCMAFSICSLTASRLKLAPFCIGGN